MSSFQIARHPGPATLMVLLSVVILIASSCTPAAKSQQGRQGSKGSGAAQNKEGSQASAPVVRPTALAGAQARNPFPNRVRMPDFPRGLEWLNTAGPLRKQDLQGKFVLLDFWTYCCINCMHILPELKQLEQAYPNQLVVIGVHSAKFEAERDSRNIADAILRYEIEHPVVNDANHRVWDTYGVRSWPYLVLIDPEGYAVWGQSGEFKAEEVQTVLEAAIPYYRQRGSLDETPVHFQLLQHQVAETRLRYPGKVLAEPAGPRLFIADSNHNRIVIAGKDGRLIDTIGSGVAGRADGDYRSASFNHPQGMALRGETLLVADTENHLIRQVDLRNKQVRTIAGTGEQTRNPWPGLQGAGPNVRVPARFVGKPLETAIASPWALWVHEDALYIAMAGPHQIWKMMLDNGEIGPYAGNGREDIVDGRLLPRQPYDTGGRQAPYSSFAQPSGLSSDGTWLYVADSEGSSIRAVPFDPSKPVRTVVGTADLAFNRLFEFGDRDGGRSRARLQHPLGVAYHDGKIFVADTYNNKIKVVNAETGFTETLAGSGQPGLDDQKGLFDEPAGVSFANGLLYVADTNNHKIRVVNPEDGSVRTLEISGLEPPRLADTADPSPRMPGAVDVAAKPTRVRPANNQVTLNAQVALPVGWKMNPLAPMRYLIETLPAQGPIDRDVAGTKEVTPPAAEFSVTLPVNGEGEDAVRLTLTYYYCQENDEGLCKIGQVVWTVPLIIAGNGAPGPAKVTHTVED